MRLYRTAAGKWAGTQAEAGKGFTLVWVPSTKPELLEFLNGMTLPAFVTTEAPAPAVEPLAIAPIGATRPAPRLNLAPLHHGAAWRERRAGIVEGAASLSLQAALDWAECSVARLRELIAGDSEAEG